jgi:hypothetical protein
MQNQILIEEPNKGEYNWNVDLTNQQCWADILDCRVFTFNNNIKILANNLHEIDCFIKQKLNSLEANIQELQQVKNDLLFIEKSICISR